MNNQASSNAVAPVLRRLAAIGYDTLLAASVVFAAAGLAVALNGDAVEAGANWFRAYLIVVVGLYFVVFWKLAGYTPGMRPWRVRIESGHGGPVTWTQTLIRFACSWLSAAVLGLGFWWAFWDRDQLMWHDRLSNTKIVRDHSLYK
jgi:uncharacterized RDD family membrane protein YckC